MAIGDFPGIPQQYNPRLSALIQKLNKQELMLKDVMDNVLSSLGRIRIDSEGINIQGDFGRVRLGPSEFRAVIDSILNSIDYFSMVRGKELLIKYGDEIMKIQMGFPVKIIPSDVWELNNEKTPAIEVIDGVKALTSVLSYLIGDMNGVVDLKEKGIKIYRLEEFVGWSADWKAFSKFLKVAIPALALTRKEVADSVRGPATELWDDVLKRCGV